MPSRGHETIDHAADMGIRGWGATPAEAFEEIAAAMFDLIADRDRIRPRLELTVRRRAPDLAGLLIEFLNALIGEGDLAGLALGGVDVEKLAEGPQGWTITAAARGIPLAEAVDALRVEVKAATYCGAFVRREEDGRWTAQCVVDL